MKMIMNHKSWSLEEIVSILERTGQFTVCALPHYRYSSVQNNCKRLLKAGLVRCHKREGINRHLSVTPLFKQWKSDKDNGVTLLQPIKYAKQFRQIQKEQNNA